MKMKMKRMILGTTLLLLLAWASITAAQTPNAAAADDPLVRQLLERIERLEAEVAVLKGASERATQASIAAPSAEPQAAPGQGPAWADRLSFHGYGEVHYNDPRGDGDMFDTHRLVLGFNYRFNEQFTAEAELDFEHSFSEPELEFAYVAWQPRADLTARFGTLLMPVGMLNQTHEPPLFYSVERPYTEKFLIPTTWQESGASLEFARGGYKGTLAITSALDPRRGSAGKLAKDGIRSLRSKSIEASGEDLAVTLTQEYRWMSGFRLGASLHRSQLDHGEEALAGADLTLGALYGQYAARGWDLRGEYVWTRIGEAARINAFLGAAPSKGIGSRMRGGYAEAAFDWFSLGDGRGRLVQFLRHERINTQAGVPAGSTAAAAADRVLWTTGLAFYPPGLDNLAFKVDFERWKDAAGDRSSALNLGIGWMF